VFCIVLLIYYYIINGQIIIIIIIIIIIFYTDNVVNANDHSSQMVIREYITQSTVYEHEGTIHLDIIYISIVLLLYIIIAHYHCNLQLLGLLWNVKIQCLPELLSFVSKSPHKFRNFCKQSGVHSRHNTQQYQQVGAYRGHKMQEYQQMMNKLCNYPIVTLKFRVIISNSNNKNNNNNNNKYNKNNRNNNMQIKEVKREEKVIVSVWLRRETLAQRRMGYDNNNNTRYNRRKQRVDLRVYAPKFPKSKREGNNMYMLFY